MPHDHPHHHHHHGPGHNHEAEAPDHLHSHLHGQGEAARTVELQTLAASFIDGFRAAADKTSYLRIAGVPFQRPGREGLTLNLVDAAIHSNWQLGSASPGFATRELAYLPYPGDLVRLRETMTFTYVSLAERRDLDLLEVLGERLDG